MSEKIRKADLRSYAKVNLCLDVKGLLESGFHEVEMILQQILLCDEVALRWEPDETPADGVQEQRQAGSGIRIRLGTNRPYLPTDRRNLAWQAAEYMAEKYGSGRSGLIRIDILKRIPVAAGLAGGSSNCAAVIHGMNLLWDLGLDLPQLCEAGAALGSDVPFCIMGQAAEDPVLKARFGDDPMAAHCAIGSGRGTDLTPSKGLKADMVLSKPPVSSSTAKAYQGIDEEVIRERPDIEEMAEALRLQDRGLVRKNMINVLENYTLKRYPIVVYTKNKMQELCDPEDVLMSGSGPTVFCLCDSRDDAKRICSEMKQINRESFWTRTTY